MPEPVDPTQPPPPSSPEPEIKTTSTSTGLPSNVAAAIACIPLIGGIIFYILEKRELRAFLRDAPIIFGGGLFDCSAICMRRLERFRHRRHSLFLLAFRIRSSHFWFDDL
jgi:uncharacterized membrane protein YbhN (UPF0104 family)